LVPDTKISKRRTGDQQTGVGDEIGFFGVTGLVVREGVEY
jgi:hypothetical protein